jgi:hypothetical protein
MASTQEHDKIKVFFRVQSVNLIVFILKMRDKPALIALVTCLAA